MVGISNQSVPVAWPYFAGRLPETPETRGLTLYLGSNVGMTINTNNKPSCNYHKISLCWISFQMIRLVGNVGETRSPETESGDPMNRKMKGHMFRMDQWKSAGFTLAANSCYGDLVKSSSQVKVEKESGWCF